MKATELIAREEGTKKCMLCGASCTDEHTTKKHIRPTFTDYSSAAVLGSEYICAGCVWSLTEGADIELIDGEKRTNQKPRSYSWLVTKDKKIAMTKAHKAYIRDLLLTPPSPPYAIALSESGQKHNLYKTDVSLSDTVPTVSIEGKNITYSVEALTARLEFVESITTLIGIPAYGSFEINTLINIPASLIDEYILTAREDLTQLALYFCKGKIKIEKDVTENGKENI
jgi:CRISPR type IV-associated protein Csf1